MTDAPERIVIDHERSHQWYSEDDAKWGSLDMTTYIRADLLEAKLREARAEALEEALLLAEGAIVGGRDAYDIYRMIRALIYKEAGE